MRLRARLRKAGHRVDLRPSGIYIDGVREDLQGEGGISFEELCLVAMSIMIDTRRESVHLVPDPKYGEAAFVSRQDRLNRIAEGVRAFAQLRSTKSN